MTSTRFGSWPAPGGSRPPRVPVAVFAARLGVAHGAARRAAGDEREQRQREAASTESHHHGFDVRSTVACRSLLMPSCRCRSCRVPAFRAHELHRQSRASAGRCRRGTPRRPSARRSSPPDTGRRRSRLRTPETTALVLVLQRRATSFPEHDRPPNPSSFSGIGGGPAGGGGGAGGGVGGGARRRAAAQAAAASRRTRTDCGPPPSSRDRRPARSSCDRLGSAAASPPVAGCTAGDWTSRRPVAAGAACRTGTTPDRDARPRRRRASSDRAGASRSRSGRRQQLHCVACRSVRKYVTTSV